MSFPSMPLAALLAGWAAIAAGLYLLQRLRVRHRELEVVTTLFWREAVEDTRARVFVKRFRHPWAYVLLLAICSLLWFAAGGFRLDPAAEREHLLLLDGSAGAGWGDRFAASRELLLEDAAALPAEHREVWWSGATARLLLRPGEHLRLLEERLAGLTPEAAPSRAGEQLMAWAASRPGAALELRFYGDAPLLPEQLLLLPDRATVLRRAPEPEPRGGNRGFLAAGISEAESGRWDQVDVLVEVAGDPGGLTISLDGQPAALPFTREPPLAANGGDGAVLRFRSLAARGQRLRLALPGGDPLAVDDAVEVVLPDRPPIRVSLAPGLPAALVALVEADPAVQVVAQGAAVVVRRFGDGHGAGLPAFELTSMDQREHAFQVRGPAESGAESLLRRAYHQLGLAEIDALALASGLDRPVSLGAEAGAGAPSVAVWDSLFDDASGFPASRSFPLFVARCLRWLASDRAVTRVAEAGRPLETGELRPAGMLAWSAEDGRTHSPAGAAFVPPAAGFYRSIAGGLAVSLLDPPATLPLPATGLAASDPGAGGAGVPAWSWLVLLAVALLLLEWHLFHRGRLP